MLGRFTQRVVAFLKKEDGPTAVEYAVMLALIIVVSSRRSATSVARRARCTTT